MDWFSDGKVCVGLVAAPGTNQLKALMACSTPAELFEHPDMHEPWFVFEQIILAGRGGDGSPMAYDAVCVGVGMAPKASDLHERTVDTVNQLRLLLQEQGKTLLMDTALELAPAGSHVTVRGNVNMWSMVEHLSEDHPANKALKAKRPNVAKVVTHLRSIWVPV